MTTIFGNSPPLLKFTRYTATGMLTKYDNHLSIDWYRSPVEPGLLRELSRRCNRNGFLQAGGHLGLIALTGSTAVYVQQVFGWLAVLPFLLAHGTVCAFLSNAVHELVHGTVFETRWLNRFFLRIFAFVRWFPYDYYWGSHTEHHKYTLHPPLDMEVVLPTRFSLGEFLKTGFVEPARLVELLRNNIRYARGRLAGDWELYLFARDSGRQAIFGWARVLLAGHLSIAVLSVWSGYWIVSVVVSLTPCYGGWLYYLCNNSQHAGLQSNVPDFRLNCRTICLSRPLQFLYWHMNFHTEHHMYPAVPCYRLARLHTAIRHDLPPPPKGLVETWQQIIAIQYLQQEDPGYRYRPRLPGSAETAGSSADPEPDAPGARGTDNRAPPVAEISGRLWQCSVCGFLYSESRGLPDAGIAPGTAWDDVPEDWRCPDCGTGKADFRMVELGGRPADAAPDVRDFPG